MSCAPKLAPKVASKVSIRVASMAASEVTIMLANMAASAVASSRNMRDLMIDGVIVQNDPSTSDYYAFR